MGRIVAILAVIALLLSAGATLAHDTSEANELFVEAVKLMESVKNVEGYEEKAVVDTEAERIQKEQEARKLAEAERKPTKFSRSDTTRWDGQYAGMAFVGIPYGTCGKVNPVKIEMSIENGLISGKVSSTGKCKNYHTGSLTGKITNSGEFVDLEIKQKHSYGLHWGSYKITGNLSKGV
mgnify:CR=1 FL=1